MVSNFFARLQKPCFFMENCWYFFNVLSCSNACIFRLEQKKYSWVLFLLNRKITWMFAALLIKLCLLLSHNFKKSYYKKFRRLVNEWNGLTKIWSLCFCVAWLKAQFSLFRKSDAILNFAFSPMYYGVIQGNLTSRLASVL